MLQLTQNTNQGFVSDSKTNMSFNSQFSTSSETSFSGGGGGGSFRYRYRSSLGSLQHALDWSWRAKRERRRLIDKNGECNVSNVHVKARNRRYIADIFTTLIDMKWRWILLLFALAFVASWNCFAFVWFIISLHHGDLDREWLVNTTDNDEAWIPCVENLHGYTSALLFSIETQHTIGYGSRMTTEECPLAIILMMMQSCFGVIIQALMTGLVFAKLARAKKRAETLMFSKKAVIHTRDGQLCLLFRLGDMRLSHLIQTYIRGILIKKHITQEGETLPLAEYDVPFGTENGNNSLLLMWPVILEHRIDECSPFWSINADDLESHSFELIIILEGVIEATGMTTQARTSYLPSEIAWGERFERLVALQRDNGQYALDYSRFNSTIKVDCPRISAKQMIERRNDGSTGMMEGRDDESVSDQSQDRSSAPSSPMTTNSNLTHRTSIHSSSTSNLSSSPHRHICSPSSFLDSSTSLTDVFCTPVLPHCSPTACSTLSSVVNHNERNMDNTCSSSVVNEHSMNINEHGKNINEHGMNVNEHCIANKTPSSVVNEHNDTPILRGNVESTSARSRCPTSESSPHIGVTSSRMAAAGDAIATSSNSAIDDVTLPSPNMTSRLSQAACIVSHVLSPRGNGDALIWRWADRDMRQNMVLSPTRGSSLSQQQQRERMPCRVDIYSV